MGNNNGPVDPATDLVRRAFVATGDDTRAFARRLKVGVRTVQYWLRGEKLPSRAALDRIGRLGRRHTGSPRLAFLRSLRRNDRVVVRTKIGLQDAVLLALDDDLTFAEILGYRSGKRTWCRRTVLASRVVRKGRIARTPVTTPG